MSTSGTNSLAGKTAVVTGAYEGIGRAIVEDLLSAGVPKVYLLDIQEGGDEVAKQLLEKYPDRHIEYMYCDVSKHLQIKEVFEKIRQAQGFLDIVCNNAGIYAEDNAHDKASLCIDINLGGMYFGSIYGQELMHKDKGGRGGVIINTASIAGLIVPPYGSAVYAATKYGVVGLSRCLGAHMMYEATGVRVNAVCPSVVHTSMTQDVEDPDGELEKVVQEKLGGRESIMEPKQVSAEHVRLILDGSATGVAVVVKKNSTEVVDAPNISLY